MSQEYTTRFGRTTRVLLPYGAGDPLTGESTIGSPGSEMLNGDESPDDGVIGEGSRSVNTERGTRVPTDVGPPPQIGREAESDRAERSADDLAGVGVIEALLSTQKPSACDSE
jgi:hypothetical protein